MRRTRWTKIKKQLRNFICTGLKDRVDFIPVVYRKAHDKPGRISITVDGKEVFSMCTITAEREACKTFRKLNSEIKNYEKNTDIWQLSEQEINARGIFGEYEFYNMLEEYFNSDVLHSLNSNHILLNIFALLDRRIGKRSLEKFSKVIHDKHDIVQYFFNLRCQVEDVKE